VNFPLLLNNPDALQVFQDITDHLPADCEVFIVGGAVRNALYYHYHSERLRQRDYDQIVTRGSQKYLDFLKSEQFFVSKVLREDQIVLARSLVPNPPQESYDDYVVFDTHTVDGTTGIDNLRYNVGLTINGFAISLRDILSENWVEHIIELPGAIHDIKSKQMHVNALGYKSDPAYLFSVLRFMSIGFMPPPKEEMKLLLNELPNLESGRFTRNITKIYNYVGGEAKARGLATSLDIRGDVFNEEAVKNGLVTI
jgi:hypothetical protein